MWESINDIFDFEILKNTFSVNDNSIKLKVSNLEKIFDKEFIFDSKENLESSLNRIDKYKNRGFNIIYPSVEYMDNLMYTSHIKGLYNLGNIEIKLKEMMFCRVKQVGNFTYYPMDIFPWTNYINIMFNDNIVILRNNPKSCPIECPYKILNINIEHIHYDLKLGNGLPHQHAIFRIILEKKDNFNKIRLE